MKNVLLKIRIAFATFESFFSTPAHLLFPFLLLPDCIILYLREKKIIHISDLIIFGFFASIVLKLIIYYRLMLWSNNKIVDNNYKEYRKMKKIEALKWYLIALLIYTVLFVGLFFTIYFFNQN